MGENRNERDHIDFSLVGQANSFMTVQTRVGDRFKIRTIRVRVGNEEHWFFNQSNSLIVDITIIGRVLCRIKIRAGLIGQISFLMDFSVVVGLLIVAVRVMV